MLQQRTEENNQEKKKIKMQYKKALIFDASSIITLALTDLLDILEPLKNSFQGEFLITEEVKYEIIDRPIKERRFMLEALFIKKLFEKGVLKLYPVNPREQLRTLRIANSTFVSNGEFIKIVHPGEVSCLVAYKAIDAEIKKTSGFLDAEKSNFSSKIAMVVDERTMRLLCESPGNLRKLLENKLHKKISSVERNYSYFQDSRLIRSCELALIAYKFNLIDLPAKKSEVIRALLYATKFSGCSLSSKEIDSLKI